MPTPRKYDKPMSEAILVRLTPEQKAQLEQMAETTHGNLVDMLRDGVLAAAEEIALTGVPSVITDWSTGEAFSVDASDFVSLGLKPPVTESPEFKETLEDQGSDETK